MNERGILGSVTKWIAHPFNSQGSALNWLLFTGLIVVGIVMWTTVVNQIAET